MTTAEKTPRYVVSNKVLNQHLKADVEKVLEALHSEKYEKARGLAIGLRVVARHLNQNLEEGVGNA